MEKDVVPTAKLSEDAIDEVIIILDLCFLQRLEPDDANRGFRMGRDIDSMS